MKTNYEGDQQIYRRLGIRGAGTLRPGHRGFMHRVDGAIHHVRHMVTDELDVIREDKIKQPSILET